MLSALLLFYVGAVLILNGLWMLGCISDREMMFINLVVGVLSLRVAHEYAFGAHADRGSVREGALSLLFAITYLWNAFNRAVVNDGRGLGWFSLFVAITASAVSLQMIWAVSDGSSFWLAVSWGAWAVLWFMFFMLLVVRKPWEKVTAWTAIGQGIFTGWLPGYWYLQA